jgi:UDP-N-acetylglucosamine:LPS N-acetylglucosamine transferase
VEAGAAFLLSEKDLPELFGKVFRLINNPEKLNAMSGRGRRLVNLKAATRMAERLLALSGVD